MPNVSFRDKVGRVQKLNAGAGDRLSDVLRASGIPANAVVSSIAGAIVSEEAAILGRDDDVLVEQVRHYDLAVTRDPPTKSFGTYTQPVYTKGVLFDKTGDVSKHAEEFDGQAYLAYVESVFVDSVAQKQIFPVGEKSIVGLSGGLDSVAFLKLVERTRAQLPPIDLTIVTVTGLPDWEEPGTFGAAQMSNHKLRFQHVIVGDQEIRKAFSLNTSFANAMTEVVASEANSMVMIATHHVMRRMIEREAERRGIATVLLGLNADDLLASLVTWYTSGFQMGPIPVRPIGPFRYAFPLYRITKKELVIYLRLLAPELTRQGMPGRFTTGPGERSLAYAVSDHLFGLWPGIDYYAFNAFERMQQYFQPKNEAVCRTCGATYALQSGTNNPRDRCDICALFSRLGVAETH